MTITRRPGCNGRAATVLLTLLLGLGLAVTPAAAASSTAAAAARHAPVTRTAAATTGTVRAVTAVPGAVAGTRFRQATSAHRASAVHLRKTRTKKKSFLKKLGIFLLVVVILVILFIALVVWLIIHLVRRVFRGRRQY
ncbi:hypothetical protein [Streptomyces sp. NPDC046942]|uniref:hypothetical protein n=1 Tax=Streptomyces sp. NPDC046942 TaxID=3155137 RepID=UPI0033EA03B4